MRSKTDPAPSKEAKRCALFWDGVIIIIRTFLIYLITLYLLYQLRVEKKKFGEKKMIALL